MLLKRGRVAQACERCARIRKRCTGTQPCALCYKGGHDCTYKSGGPLSRKRKSFLSHPSNEENSTQGGVSSQQSSSKFTGQSRGTPPRPPPPSQHVGHFDSCGAGGGGIGDSGGGIGDSGSGSDDGAPSNSNGSDRIAEGTFLKAFRAGFAGVLPARAGKSAAVAAALAGGGYGGHRGSNPSNSPLAVIWAAIRYIELALGCFLQTGRWDESLSYFRQAVVGRGCASAAVMRGLVPGDPEASEMHWDSCYFSLCLALYLHLAGHHSSALEILGSFRDVPKSMLPLWERVHQMSEYVTTGNISKDVENGEFRRAVLLGNNAASLLNWMSWHEMAITGEVDDNEVTGSAVQEVLAIAVDVEGRLMAVYQDRAEGLFACMLAVFSIIFLKSLTASSSAFEKVGNLSMEEVHERVLFCARSVPQLPGIVQFPLVGHFMHQALHLSAYRRDTQTFYSVRDVVRNAWPTDWLPASPEETLERYHAGQRLCRSRRCNSVLSYLMGHMHDDDDDGNDDDALEVLPACGGTEDEQTSSHKEQRSRQQQQHHQHHQHDDEDKDEEEQSHGPLPEQHQDFQQQQELEEQQGQVGSSSSNNGGGGGGGQHQQRMMQAADLDSFLQVSGFAPPPPSGLTSSADGDGGNGRSNGSVSDGGDGGVGGGGGCVQQSFPPFMAVEERHTFLPPYIASEGRGDGQADRHPYVGNGGGNASLLADAASSAASSDCSSSQSTAGSTNERRGDRMADRLNDRSKFNSSPGMTDGRRAGHMTQVHGGLSNLGGPDLLGGIRPRDTSAALGGGGAAFELALPYAQPAHRAGGGGRGRGADFPPSTLDELLFPYPLNSSYSRQVAAMAPSMLSQPFKGRDSGGGGGGNGISLSSCTELSLPASSLALPGLHTEALPRPEMATAYHGRHHHPYQQQHVEDTNSSGEGGGNHTADPFNSHLPYDRQVREVWRPPLSQGPSGQSIYLNGNDNDDNHSFNDGIDIQGGHRYCCGGGRGGGQANNNDADANDANSCTMTYYEPLLTLEDPTALTGAAQRG